jgi:hypothetical protein
MKAVMLSINPKWCELIASGKKTVEVRKNKPKLETPFKVYIYCTADRRKHICDTFVPQTPLFVKNGVAKSSIGKEDGLPWKLGNGKVIGEFVCDRIIDIPYSQYFVDYYHTMPQHDLEATCLGMGHIDEYLLSKDGYGWHISDLVIYDYPRNLSGFYHYCGDDPNCDGCDLHYFSNTECGKEDYCCSPLYGCKHLKRPPQSWCYCEELKGEK